MSIRSELLEALLAGKGSYLSGEELAERLSCSRTAVWKAVKQLRETGYQIDAVQNKGYALSRQSDVLSEEEIGRFLEGAFPVRVYQEIGSTNDTLKQLALSEHAAAGLSLVSDHQTGGKGRLGRSFFSPKGTGLYLSMLLRPQSSVNDSLMLTAQSAVAVYRAVRRVCGIELSIKWVNDLYYQGKKVCGILSEGQANFENGRLEYVIVGIGLNIYEPEEGFPEEISGKAGSLLGKKSEGGYLNRNLLAAEIIREFYALSEEKTLSPEYTERNLLPGREITVLDGKQERRARALSILPDGRLEIEEADGSRNVLVYGEISVRL